MNRPIALAYAITGLAVAAALIALIGSTAGLFGTRPSADVVSLEPTASPEFAPLGPTAAPGDPAPALASNAPEVLGAPSVEPRGQPEPVVEEIVYVDAPPTRRHSDDDRGDRGEREHHEREDDDD